MLEINQPMTCLNDCPCTNRHEPTRLVVLTGGPGAGKTAVLEIIRKELCEHVVILPEAASIIFGGGFWRLNTVAGQQSAQRAIMVVQQEMEKLFFSESKWALGLCDRGVPDGLAYWPGDEQGFWEAAKSSFEKEYKKYHAVIHLRTPTDELGYNHQNPLRTETSVAAAAIDEKIHKIWSGHPRYKMVESTKDFLHKAQKANGYIKEYLPECCVRASQTEIAEKAVRKLVPLS